MMPDPGTPAAVAATPIASPAAGGAAPYGIDAVKLPPGLAPDRLESKLFNLPDDVAGLPQRQTLHDADSATVVYVVEQDPSPPKFGIVVILKVTPAADADATVADIERRRWGDPKDHDVSARGVGMAAEPAYREFSRVFPPGLFLLPYRPVYFLIWYRAGDEYAFMIIGDSPATREGLARAVAGAFRR